MSEKLNFELTPRREGTRLKGASVQFDLKQIKLHFDEGCAAIHREDRIVQMLENERKNEDSMRILRSQVVFLEGILDFYIHEISKYALYQMFLNNWTKSERYKRINVPITNVEVAIDAPEEKSWFYDFMNEKLSREVYLSADSMKDQLNMIGIPFIEVLQLAFSSQFPELNEENLKKKGKEIISQLFDRRNRIVHQDDRNHASAVQTPIEVSDVQAYFTYVEAIVSAIQEIAEKNSIKES